MSGLVDTKGNPLSSKIYNKKADPPAVGPAYGRYSGEDAQYFKLPGGGAIQFDLSQLTLDDYRQMKDHYQINNSLTILTFLLHQMEWSIKLDGPALQKDFYTEQIDGVWTPLVRSKATAFWAGYSPNAVEYDNNVNNRRFELDKIKDLVPEDCRVRWKKVDGRDKLKLSIFDGIYQWGAPPIPVTNAYWYPLLMENGDYYGRKLLRSAFQPWFFSILMHLFANRYYERFGEPTPIGRAPYDDKIHYNGTEVFGNEAMVDILSNLRSRGVVILPNDKTPYGNETSPGYDYDIQYLESQMRGADFERYMTRLDEEMSLALFTPILLMRTADVGSYNLGTQHSIIYQWMLNAISGDWARYINKYLLRPLRDFNFGPNAPLPKISFRRMGQQNQDIVNNIVAAQIAKGAAKPDYEQLGEIAGLSLKEVKQVTASAPTPADPNDPNADPNADPGKNVYNVADRICDRIEEQVDSGFRRKKLDKMNFSLGFQRHMDEALATFGFYYSTEMTREFYTRLEMILDNMAHIGQAYGSTKSFMVDFRKAVTIEVDRLLKEL